MAASASATDQTTTEAPSASPSSSSASASSTEPIATSEPAQPSTSPSQSVLEVSPTSSDAPTGSSVWADYPWAASDGLECYHPAESPGSDKDPSSPNTAVVMGDSNIRNDRGDIAAALSDIGFDTTFLCWGGKQLPWGEAQLGEMSQLDIHPACLVVNLGTNDLKGTTANGLDDAVSPSVVQERLTSLLDAASAIPHVVVVDVAANTSNAPSTMKRVGELVGIYADVTSSYDNVTLAPWSAYVSEHPDSIGSDGIHDSGSGSQARASVIADAVKSACG